MDKKKILLISAVLAIAALPTSVHVGPVDLNPLVWYHIDAQLLVACLGAISAILLRPAIRDRGQSWRKRRVAKWLYSRQARK
jgi:hypothetical protein